MHYQKLTTHPCDKLLDIYSLLYTYLCLFKYIWLLHFIEMILRLAFEKMWAYHDSAMSESF